MIIVPHSTSHGDFQVVVGAGYTVQRTRYYQTKGPMKKLAHLVAYGNTKSIARFVLKDLVLRTHILSHLSKLMKEELRQLLSDKHNSILQEKFQVAMEYFTWSSVWHEISTYAPFLVAVLRGVATTSSSDPDNVKRIIGVCISILLKFRNPKMCHVQAVISLLMHIGHSSKQV